MQVFLDDPDRVLSPGWRRWSLDAVRTDLWEGPGLRLPDLFDNAYDGDESDNDGPAPLPGIDTAAIVQTAPKKRSSRRAHRWRPRVPSLLPWRLQPTWRIMPRVLKLSILVFCALLLPVLLLLLYMVGYLAYFAGTIWWSVFSVRHDIDPSSMSEEEVKDLLEDWVERNFDHYWYRISWWGKRTRGHRRSQNTQHLSNLEEGAKSSCYGHDVLVLRAQREA